MFDIYVDILKQFQVMSKIFQYIILMNPPWNNSKTSKSVNNTAEHNHHLSQITITIRR